MSDPRGTPRRMEKQSPPAVDPAEPQPSDAPRLRVRVEELERELAQSRGEIDELLQELEEKALALAASRVAETAASMGVEGPAQAAPPQAAGPEPTPAPHPEAPAEAGAAAGSEATEGTRPPRRIASLVRSALEQGASQSRMRIAFLEEELGRQAERHAAQIAELEAHFVSKLAEVAGGGDVALVRALQERIVALEQERADPPHLVQARATIGRLLAEQEDLRVENRYLSAEVERWAAKAQEAQGTTESQAGGRRDPA